MGLMVVYLTGLLLGCAIYILTFFFSKDMDDIKRIAILVVISLTAVIGGLAVGGFGGMPVSLMGAAVLTVSFLLWIGERSPLWKKTVLAIVVLISIGGLVYLTFGPTQKVLFS